MFVSIVLKSGSLNLLEPSGPLQALSGIALPFMFVMLYVYSKYVVLYDLQEQDLLMGLWKYAVGITGTEGPLQIQCRQDPFSPLAGWQK